MVNNKKEAEVGRNQEESDLTKQSNLLNFVNAMDLSQSTLSWITYLILKLMMKKKQLLIKHL